VTAPIYHYTCEHGRQALGERGAVRPLADWNPRAATLLGNRIHMAMLSWFTDLDVAVPHALGLTRGTIECDRTAHRYRVIDDGLIVPWLASPWRRGWLLDLERVKGAMPRHWYVATVPVRVVLS
jgi:hypothetical protein